MHLIEKNLWLCQNRSATNVKISATKHFFIVYFGVRTTMKTNPSLIFLNDFVQKVHLYLGLFYGVLVL